MGYDEPRRKIKREDMDWANAKYLNDVVEGRLIITDP